MNATKCINLEELKMKKYNHDDIFITKEQNIPITTNDSKLILLIFIFNVWCEENVFLSNEKEMDVFKIQIEEDEFKFDYLSLNMTIQELSKKIETFNFDIIYKKLYPFEKIELKIMDELSLLMKKKTQRKSILVNKKKRLFLLDERKTRINNGAVSNQKQTLLNFDIYQFDLEIQKKANFCFINSRPLPTELNVLINKTKQTFSTRSFEIINYNRLVSLLCLNKNYDNVCLHEVILDEKPCRFYLDIDIKLNETQTVAEYEIFDLEFISLIKIIHKVLLLYLEVELREISYDQIKIRNIILDSSDKTKFSRHLILNLLILPRNVEFYFYYKEQILKLVEQVILESNEENLKIAKFIDKQVYSSNRNFRTVFSSKIESKKGVSPRILLPIGDFSKKYKSYLEEWLQNKNFSIKNFYLLDTQNKKAFSEHIKKFDSIEQIIKSSLITYRAIKYIGSNKNITLNITNSNKVQINNNHQKIDFVMKNNHKKFKIKLPSLIELFEYLFQNAQVGEKQNIFEKYDSFFISNSIIKEDMFYLFIATKNHQCLIANREHTSNYIWFILDLKNKVLYQKCFDQECKNDKYLIFCLTFSEINSLFENKHNEQIDSFLKKILIELLTFSN